MTEDVGGYVLLDEIGRGAFSVVYRAEKRGHPGRVVAVKHVRTQISGLDRIREEAAVLAALSHRGIVPLLESVPLSDGAALIMPYLPGGSLADLLARNPDGLPWRDVADLGARLAAALAAAHGAGVLHRDVKPANVLFGAEGEPHLADFGASFVVGADGPLIGTAEYLDPAVANGVAPDVRSDIYALGVVLYETLAGRRPSGEPLRVLVPDCPDELAAIIERAMADEPSRRYSGAQALQGDLEAVAATAPLASSDALPTWAAMADRAQPATRIFGPRPPRPEGEEESPGRPTWAWLALAAVVLVPLLAVAVLWPRGVDPSGAAMPEAPALPPERTAVPCGGQDAGGGGVLLADVDGRGCALVLTVSEETVDGEAMIVLTVPAAGGALAGRYVVAAAGETVLVGDWDCDGIDTPAVVRGTGEVFLYPSFGEVASTSAAERVDGEPVVVSDGECDQVVSRVDETAAARL